MNNCRCNNQTNRRMMQTPVCANTPELSNYSNYISSMCKFDSFENMSKCELMEHLQFISFAIDDLRLFLDTHPCNDEAMELIRELMHVRHLVVKIYTKNFGPIYSYYVDVDNGWSWNEKPMPWSKGGM